MNDYSVQTKTDRKLWVRALIMILMGLAYQLTGTLLLFLAIIQFILALLVGSPNPRLARFGSSLGRYHSQIANFVSFASDDPPFPFADWPST